MRYAGESHTFAQGRVFNCQTVSIECNLLTDTRGAIVALVTENRTAAPRQLCPNLVVPTGMKQDIKQRETIFVTVETYSRLAAFAPGVFGRTTLDMLFCSSRNKSHSSSALLHGEPETIAA